MLYNPRMTNEKIDLEGQINEKKAQLASLEALLDNYAKTLGRDRWYNRSRCDVSDLRQELAALENLRNPETVAPS